MFVSIEKLNNQYLCFDGEKYFFEKNPHSLHTTLICDKNYDAKGQSKVVNIDVVCRLAGEKYEFKNDLLESIKNSYNSVSINVSDFLLYQILNEQQFNTIAPLKLKNMYEYVKARENDVLFNTARKYYENVGNSQYHLLDKIHKQVLPTQIHLKFHDTRTGRLACSPDSSVNVLTMPIVHRDCIKSREKYQLVKFDFIACQVRLCLFLMDNELYKEKDPYSEIAERIKVDREIAKKCSISYIFGANARLLKKYLTIYSIKRLKEIFDLDRINIHYINQDYVTNYFGRPIKIEDDKKGVLLNNIFQSFERDLLLLKAVEVNEYLKNNKIGRILFPFHDALIIEINKHNLNQISEIRSIIESSSSHININMFSKVSIGNNLKEMTDYYG